MVQSCQCLCRSPTQGGGQSLGKTTELSDLPVPIVKATLTLPGRATNFRRALSSRVAVPWPTGGTLRWFDNLCARLGTQLSGQRVYLIRHKGPG